MAKSKGYGAIAGNPDMKWRAESDMRTLVEAEVIKADKKRYKAAQACAKEQAEGLEQVFNTEPNDKD
jgi:hypothetical protein